MKFDLVDRVLEVSPTRIVTVKHVTNAEEYLQDHFPTFPVLPGVMMLEALVQAARRLLVQRNIPGAGRMVLGQVRALKYGAFVPPGCALRCEVELLKDPSGDLAEFRGQGTLLTPDAIGGSAGGGAGGGGALPAGDVTAVSGRFVLRAVRVARIGDV